jgi:hypothetical protein
VGESGLYGFLCGAVTVVEGEALGGRGEFCGICGGCGDDTGATVCAGDGDSKVVG